MNFFNPTKPVIRTKQKDLDVQDLQGLWKIDLKIGNFLSFSSFYTRIDQVFLLWGWLSLLIFTIAQFLPISWMTQAYWWSVLTILGTVGMVMLTYYWARVENLIWVIYWWAVLMLIGVGLTNLGIFCGWGAILLNLCPLWLGLSALGYWGTGFGMRSYSFTLAGFLHLVAILFLPYLPSWQFLTTGIVIGGTLLLFAEIQWDMRPPIEYEVLTVEEITFNREQQRNRQMS